MHVIKQTRLNLISRMEKQKCYSEAKIMFYKHNWLSENENFANP